MRKKVSVFIILLSGIIAGFAINSLNLIRENDPEYINKNIFSLFSADHHAPIQIDGNAELTSFFNGSGADGTFSNPFIIDNYNITDTIHGTLINISNTDLYLIIKNLMIDNPPLVDRVIFLYNCTNIEIKQSSIYSVLDGILLVNSSNIIISENNLTVSGIELYYSNNNYIFNNNLSNNVPNIRLEGSNNNTISGNIARNSPVSISLIDSNNNWLQDNFVWNEIGFDYYLDCYVCDVTVSSDDVAAILLYLENSHNNTLLRNVLQNNRLGNGIHLLNSNNNILMENNVTNNYCSGITLISSNENMILKNYAFNNNEYGVYIDLLSKNNSINENIFHSNNETCIFKGNPNNDFSENECLNQSIPGYIPSGILGFGMTGCIIVLLIMLKKVKKSIYS